MWPSTAKILLDYLSDRCKHKGLSQLAFEVPELPLSLNHQYESSIRYKKDEHGKKRGYVSKRLKPEATRFRWLTKSAINKLGLTWEPKGVTAAIIFYHSSEWITKKRTVRVKDADNLVKPVLDATQHAVNVPDELHWEFHAYKICSTQEKTTVFLFDLGDIVEYHCL